MLIDAAVEQLALLEVVFVNGVEPADGLVVGQHVAQDVDAEGGRRVVEAVLLHVDAVTQIARQLLVQALVQQVLADDDHRHARGAEVLLGARVDEPEGLHVEGFPKEV